MNKVSANNSTDKKEKKCRWYILYSTHVEDLPEKQSHDGRLSNLPRQNGEQSIILGIWHLSRQNIPVCIYDFHRLYICIEETGQWRVKTIPTGAEAVPAPLFDPDQYQILKQKLLADFGELAWRAALPYFAQRCHDLLGNHDALSPVKKTFNNLNQFFFNGFLPPLNIYWNSRLQLTHGRLVVCNPESYWIELHPYCQRFEAILLREMVRYWVLLHSGCACDTSPLFIEKCLEVRAPLNIEHYPSHYYAFVRAVAHGQKNS